MNVGKTKIMVSGDGSGAEEQSGMYPCGVCSKGVGVNSIQCTHCIKWVHKKCSGVSTSLTRFLGSFVCKRCLAPEPEAPLSIPLESGECIERVQKFCYLGDMLNANGGVASAVVTRTRCAWKKFRELSSILEAKRVSLRMKSKLYHSCVRPSLIYGSETWAMKAEDNAKINRADLMMIRKMIRGGFDLSQKECRKRSNLESIISIVRKSRLRWVGHVERKEEDDWTRKCMSMDIGGKRPQGRPKTTWMSTITSDMKKGGVTREVAMDRKNWRSFIWKLADPD